MKFYTYNDFEIDINLLADKILKSNIKLDCILAVARGGMVASVHLSHLLKIRACFCITCISYENTKQNDNIKITQIPNLNEYKHVLIVDDIVDSGRSLNVINKILKERFNNNIFINASIFYKNTACIKPDFYIHETQEWIKFPWEC